MSRNTPRRILVILGSKAFGDALEAFPVFQLIREFWPEVHLGVGYQTKGQRLTLEMCRHISELISICPGSVRRSGIGLRRLTQNFHAMKGFEIILFLYKSKV